jgi:uncharacterized membrane protein
VAKAKDAPVELYVAAYTSPDVARGDWETIKALAGNDEITVDGLALVRRSADGKIHVEDNLHQTAKGAAWGAVGGAVVGLIFPPTLLVGAALGAAAGAGYGELKSLANKVGVISDVEATLPVTSSGIVAVVDERWSGLVERSLANANRMSKRELDGASVKEVKSAVAAEPPAV